MAEITAKMVKELREKTGAGMMDCKTALKETDGDFEAAVDWLRAKGLAKAAKKAGRVAADGLVGIAFEGTAGAVVEVNSETDFVARNETFQEAVRKIAQLALATEGDTGALLAASMPGTDGTTQDFVTGLVATIGENITLRRSQRLTVGEGVVAAYMHNAVAPDLGKIGVLVALESSGDAAALQAVGKHIAMHIAATNPAALSTDDLDPALIERERQIFVEQARESGKPENIIEKMVEGRLRKFQEEVVLLKQTFVVDGERTVEKVVADAAQEAGAPVTLTGFVRFGLGEGVEKEETDFAAEVQAAVKGA